MIRSKREKEVGLSEEEKKIAAKLKELAAAADKAAMEETDYEQMSPIEQLSADIAAHLANNAACRIAGIIEEADQGSAKQLVIRFENSDSRTLVRMIQAIFLSHGMKHAAEELDVLEDCEPFDSEVFDAFADEFLGAEEIDRYTVEAYILEEMPCEHNEGYILQKFYFTVDQKSQNGFVDLETITDDVPEIGTTASVNGKNKDIRPQKEITLFDVIEYKNLKKGETYTAKGVLMDKATGKPVLDINGKEITAEQEFKTFMSNGKVKVTFTFDATSLYGKDTVVFEKVYDSEGHVAAKHEEINDEGQTVTWEHMKPSYEMYKIRTTKAPSAGDKYGFFAQDEVEYEVHVENTGNIEITMDVTDQFTQNPEYFTVPKLKDVKFTAKGSWNNKGKDEFKANITLEPGEKATVTYTAVVKDEAKAYLAAKAKDSDSKDDKGNDTNRVYQKNKTDDKDGYWNTAKCENVTYPKPDNPDEPGTLEPKDDVAQTPVQKPSIGTSLANGKGDKTVAAAKDTQLIDTIAYIGLDTSKWYVFEGTLMVKDSGDPLVEHGKPVTVMSEPFKPARANGTAKVSFIIDTTNLDGKELVAFENCYRLNDFKKGDDVSKADKTVVAEHKDLKDEGQTVKVSKTAKSVPPKTGDNTMLWLYGGLFIAAMGGMLFFVAREYARKRRQAREDAEMFA